jgi:putative membrane protein
MESSAIHAIERPHKNLLVLYFLQSLAGLFLAPVIFVPLLCRYLTLRYRFDDEGIGASWGVLFRREVYLTYRRIQDIHVTRNVLERWLGIARVQVQTASGSSSAEMTLEGMQAYEDVRDWLYARMRGTADAARAHGEPAAAERRGAPAEQRVLELLEAIRGELEGARSALEARG